MFTRRLATLSCTLLLAACAAQAPVETDDTANEPLTVRWSWSQIDTGPDDIPVYEVKLIDGNDEARYVASCNGVVSTSTIEESDIAVRCWWAGGGEDFAVIDGDDGWTVQKRWVDEESGFGEWEEVAALQ